MNKVTILAVSLLLASCSQQPTNNTPLNQSEKDTTGQQCNITSSIPDTTTNLIQPLYPVPVVKVDRIPQGNKYKYEVASENGVVFYTNKRYKIGDAAFYMDGECEKLYWLKD